MSTIGNETGKMKNNLILKKLRIALDLKEADLFQIFELSGNAINKSLLSGIFRKEGHKNYRECSEKLLEDFLNGFIILKRGKLTEPAEEIDTDA